MPLWKRHWGEKQGLNKTKRSMNLRPTIDSSSLGRKFGETILVGKRAVSSCRSIRIARRNFGSTALSAICRSLRMLLLFQTRVPWCVRPKSACRFGNHTIADSIGNLVDRSGQDGEAFSLDSQRFVPDYYFRNIPPGRRQVHINQACNLHVQPDPPFLFAMVKRL